MPRVACDHCRVEMYRSPSTVRSKMFCSNACRGAFQKAIPDTERFWAKVPQKRGDGCWIWTGTLGSDGYGRFGGSAGGDVYAHRFSYLIHKGPIAKGLSVMHSCDRPACCNPAHLSLGTQKDNMADAAAKKRTTHGERNRSAKLTEAQVREIPATYSRPSFGKSNAYELAENYGVSHTAILAVVSRHTWRHV